MTKSLANRLYIKQRLYSFKIADEKGMEEQLDSFNKIVDDLENIDVKLEDEDKAIILLNALPKSYEQLKDVMLYGRETSITMEEVQTAPKCKELQKQGNKVSSDPVAESLIVKGTKGKKNFKKKGNGSKPCYPPQKAGQDQEKETRSCHYCKKLDHLKKNCFSWKRKQTEKENNKNTTDFAEELEIPKALTVAERSDELPWIMDSGCSFYVCPVESWFYGMAEANGSVLLGNNKICSIRGIGNIRLRLHDGSIRLLTGVRFIPEIKRNLISLGVLDTGGYACVLSDEVMNIMKDNKVVVVAERKRSLYYLKAAAVSGAVNVVHGLDLRTWHLRLGHLAEACIKELGKKKLIKLADASQQQDVCEQCMLGKSKKLPYTKGFIIQQHPWTMPTVTCGVQPHQSP